MPNYLLRIPILIIEIIYDTPLERVTLASMLVGLISIGQSVSVMQGTELAVPALLALALLPVAFLLLFITPLLHFGVVVSRWVGMALFVLAGVLAVGVAVTRWAEAGGVPARLDLILGSIIGIFSGLGLVQLYVLRDEFLPEEGSRGRTSAHRS